MIQMQNDEYDGPSHAFVKVNHSSWLYIQFNLQFMLSCIKIATPRMNIIISLFCFIPHPVADSLMMWLQCLLQLTLNIPPASVTFRSPVSLCIVTTVLTEFYDNKQEIETFHSELETNVIVIRLRRSGKPFHLFKLKNKNKSDSKESKFGDKHETRDNNPVNIHLQVSWFTLRA